MSKRAKIVLVLALLGICATGVVLIRPKVSNIESHKAAIARLQFPPRITRLNDYFSRSYLLWNLQSRPNFRQAQARYDHHVESLIALGYLERRTFRLEKQRIDTASYQRFCGMVQATAMSGTLGPPDRPTQCSANQDLRSFTVVGRPKYMLGWEQVIRAFDSTNSPPNPQGGASGRQPFGSDTNQTSAAAAPRRLP
jgi:hypothetical protein